VITVIKIILIPVDEDKPIELREVGGKLEEYQGFVGGYIEVLNTDDCSMYVNDEGKIASLPPNRRATDFLFAKIPEFWDIIVGDAVVVGPPDGEGNDTSVPPEVVSHFGLDG
jgi:hypothetical protein